MDLIGIYERVSTAAQDLAAQHGDLETWATARDGVRWYADKCTGKTMNRPHLTRLLTDVRAGRVKTVVVWRLDRLGRTASGLTALFDELTGLGVNFISLRDGIDLKTPAGRLIANVLASVAAYETEVRSERITAGIAAKRRRGETWGNGRPKGTADKLTPAVRKQIDRMVGDRTSKAEIARVLKLSRQSVYRHINGE